jgi:hypothetical protein
MIPFDSNGRPLIQVGGSLGFDTIISTAASNNVMILNGILYIKNETDSKYYKIRCATQNDTPYLFLDDVGMVRGF